MLEIVHLILPVFITIFIGYLIAHFKVLEKEHFKVMGLFAIKVAIPCLLLVSISSHDFHSLIQVPYLIAYSLASFIVFLSAFGIYRYVIKTPITESSVMAMGSSMSNTGFIGSGLLYMFLGERAAIYFGMTFLVENFVIFLMFLICLELGKSQQSLKDILKTGLSNIIKNPIIIALIIGSALSFFSLQLPEQLIKVLQPIGQTTMPVGLLVIGGSLYGITLASQKKLGRDLSITVSLKLVTLPLLVFGIFQCLPNTNAEMIFAGTLLSSVSMVGLFAIFGQQYDMKKVPTILLFSTLLSIFSISTVIHFLHL
ncbi:hypothetical protein A3K93_13255 (plasmid) [Acinetobacter sp. NCu2D-2]|uniref:AEC family transporter n=1 Tax=Acinetobacter sp. NCu2D-2 TaxID=1608473 RepID=UPI0007CDFAA7|nr:AEC family transporter [Acinetobacter sp. NCu2D-2]ANF83212.1 hypothetical protein A3K93_13255 [Acinetobacter sp. NCu2D-2]